ncbi:MAG: efflux RND transporter permease subunit [Gemmatimonadales bacterium]|nr:MAG: efflux RND transporter permease subunit [Gemmatimonadales bacterium]
MTPGDPQGPNDPERANLAWLDGGERRRVPEDDPAFLARFKEFGLTSFALAHRTSVVMLFLIVSFAGLVAYNTIPKESSPEIAIPILVVNTLYPGVSPADMETLVTRPLEDELNTISEVREMVSTSVEGYSSISVEFSTSTDLNEALQKVREKVDLARPNLPGDAEDPSIVEINISEFPIMQVNLAGEYGLVRLKEIGEELQDRIEQLPQVLRVDLRGGLEREVKVDVDLGRLKYHGMAIQDVVDAIRDENVNIPGGSIEVGTQNYLVRVDGEFVDPSVIEDLIVGTFDGRGVYVRDIASVDFGFAERTSYARLDGNPVVTLDVVKRSGDNIIQTAESVKDIIAAMEGEFPPTTRVSITGDQSRDIYVMVSSLENNIISGLILILSVLLFFLGLRTAAFVAVAIPTSMLLSFVVLAVMGITMNMVVLFSLILALGMLVDNAIVIVENIYRYVEEGWTPAMAARKATGEVALPVVAATATTLAAFAPLLFWPGVTGEFMKFLPLTLIITLSSSLFVALVIVPTLCAIFLKPEGAPTRPLTLPARWTILGVVAVALVVVAASNWLTALLLAGTVIGAYFLHTRVLDRMARVFQTRGIPVIARRYEGSIRWALDHRAVVLGICAVVFVGTFALFVRFNHGVEFFPESIPPSQLIVEVEAPVGTRVAFTDGVATRLEEEVRGFAGFVDVESVVTTSGGGGGGGMFGGGSSAESEARMTLSLIDFKDREEDAFETLARMQAELGAEVPGAEVRVDMPDMGPPSGASVNIEVVGTDPAVLKRISDEVLATLRSAPVAERLVGLQSDLDEGRPELSVYVDRERASLYGLSTAEVGSAIRGAIQGVEAAKYRTGNDEYDIVVRLAEPYRNELSALQELVVMAEGGAQVPLLSVAEWEVGEGLGSIRRKDMDRVATISSEVRAGFNQNAVLAEVQATLADFAATGLPPGYQLRYTGQLDDQNEAQAFLSMAFGIALLLIAFILISQFNSVVKPLIILTSVVMSTVGVLLGLMVFNMPFVIIMTGVGIISLAGIVVNNAIVLIDYIDILRERDGMNRREALVQGGMTRLRPVLLTAITTALGLVPLAIGLNFDFFGLYRSLTPDFYWGGEQAAWWSPMAIAVIVGIIFATFLTLIVVPVMYSLVDDAMALFQKHFVGEVEAAPGAPSRARPAADGEGVPPLDPQDDPEAEEVPETVGASLRRSASDPDPGGGHGPGLTPGGRGGLEPRPV